MTDIDVAAVCAEAQGRTLVLPGHFVDAVRVEAAEPIGADNIVYLRVRTGKDELKDLPIDAAELRAALAVAVPATRQTVAPEDFWLLVESARIRLAFAHDPYFAVSLTGIDVLPHQLEAVYERMLPQVMLRFLLADDPGSGKTIMAGLLMKELRLRDIVERALVVCPAPLTIQWQDELSQKFDEKFELMTSERIRGTLSTNPWHEYQRCIVSMDLAKRPEIRERLLEADWDIVVVDEAHKCSARTDAGDKVTKTQRYQLVERLSPKTERLLLLTATPHQGNRDQFAHFLRLLEEDQFVDLDRDKQVIQLEGNPWYLRRMKEDLRDFDGRKLFTERHARTQPFTLEGAEYELYDEVTRYINDFLPRVMGKHKQVFALTRIVFQRRLASSLAAITSTLGRRHKRLSDMLAEVESLPASERAKKLEQFRLIDLGLVDDETELDDETEEMQNQLIDSVVVAETIERLREEVVELQRLVRLARETLALGKEEKLDALKRCLDRTEFSDLKDGRGRLLVFTEHKDTLDHLVARLDEWGYTTTTIHGGMSPQERRERQIEFQRDAQICVATEAAGEGINLQFCHLMINYDMPWNPMRLEQRMGRIHRIGQKHDVYVFNFAATNTIEGRIVATLLEKLAQIKDTLGDRVFDVIGELLKLNDVNLEDLLREAAYNPKDIDAYLSEIERIDPERLRQYEEATGIALAKSNIDLRRVRGEDWRSEERRLMPEFVEGFFTRAALRTGLQLEQRADGLWRLDVPNAFRADSLRSVKRLGRPDARYPKFTFRKEQARESRHLDSELMSPGHRLFAAIDEVLNQQVAATRQGVARFLDPFSPRPYRLHFFEVEVEGGTVTGGYEPATGVLVTVVEDDSGNLEHGAADVLHDLTPAVQAIEVDIDPDAVDRVRKWVMGNVQHPLTTRTRDERVSETAIRKEYLEASFAISIRKAQARYMRFADEVNQGHDELKLVRDNAAREVEALKQRREEKLTALENIAVVAAGKVEYLGTAIVEPSDAAGPHMHRDHEVERAAMEHVMAWEQEQGWEPTDVSNLRDGSGFDIRSVGPEDADGFRPVRRIEVKGRAAENVPVELTPNEWIQAGRHRETYWLYVVWNAKSAPRLLRISDPVRTLQGSVEELNVVNGYRVPAEAIERAAS